MNNFGNTEMAMFYNVENLFPPDPIPVHRLNPTPSGLRNWDHRKYQNKLSKLAHVFQMVHEKHLVMPMLIGISEVQGDKVLEDLVSSEPFQNKFGIVHYESLDERGVDVALIYDKEKIEIIHSEPISFIFEFQNPQNSGNYDTTRDVLYCKVKYNNLIINVFIFHLPSKRALDVNKPKRDYIINSIKEKIEDIISKDNESVILLGDFNENPDDENLRKIIYDKESNKILNNPFSEIFQNQKFSTFHYKSGLLFDQIILSNHFYSEDSALGFEEAGVFNPERLSNWDKKNTGRPFRTYAGTRYLGGYSDHFPVFVKFRKR